MNVKGLPLRRSVTEAAKVRFQIEFAPQYEPFESARFSMKRLRRENAPARNSFQDPRVRSQYCACNAVELRRGFTQSTLVQPH